MGSAASCASRPASAAGSKPVKVIDGKGRMQEFFYSIRAAELMIENPGHFVCDSTNLEVGRRVPGLAADQELLRRRLYFLLPTDLLFSVLTEEEMTWLLRRAAGAKAMRSRRRRPRVICVKTRKEEESLRLFPAAQAMKEEERRRFDGPSVMQRMRSWEPALDTIEEEGANKI